MRPSKRTLFGRHPTSGRGLKLINSENSVHFWFRFKLGLQVFFLARSLFVLNLYLDVSGRSFSDFERTRSISPVHFTLKSRSLSQILVWSHLFSVAKFADFQPTTVGNVGRGR